MSNTMPSADVQRHFEELLNRVWLLQEELIIERAGKRIARLLPFHETIQPVSGKLDFRKSAGLGAEIWQAIHVESYIQAERDAWD